MLTDFYIENIAVVEKTNIEFKEGLNVLTGETGAGKSIIIDAIHAVLGHRTSKEIIRNGASSAFVSATFCGLNDFVLNKAQELGFLVEDDTIIISRELSLSGKNTCRVNDRPATVSAIRELSRYLINIHGQNDNLEILSPESHITYIDNLGEYDDLKNKYLLAYKKYNDCAKKLKEYDLDENKRLSQIDLLTFQVNEINEAQLELGEDESLESEKLLLLNGEKICKSLNSAKSSFNKDGGVLSSLDEAVYDLQKAAGMYPQIEGLSNRVYDIYYELRDCSDELDGYIDELDLNPYRLDEIENRLDLIYKLKRKYGNSVEEILKYGEDAQISLDELLKYDFNKTQLEKECKEYLNEANLLAEKLSDERKKVSLDFQRQVKKEMQFLDMPNVELVVKIEKTPLCESGCDKIEFLISANVGEPPKPVSKIASGGELSRMMLAIKTVLAKSDMTQTLIFDEIDTGISGSATRKVGLKLKEVSKSRQVMCVTHQAQIAALADTHFKIKKQIENGRTFTVVEPLDLDGRKKELARIVGGVEITQAALDYAQELLSQNAKDENGAE